ncbi:hypothetical protein G7062_06155 [Erysipelothrix sp. HDW6C]|uniref:hypothetical protein n=1 Tax=Erysipelothrix sp. HDW6C TaxID=2714930 RepID=UPI001409104C|nr:hypothetical protein [Erysipelothrix sp. HDW6C]QIK69899.1 hypothetical protein G7062_06155 [Erysipelothrix sp. HDW6C]
MKKSRSLKLIVILLSVVLLGTACTDGRVYPANVNEIEINAKFSRAHDYTEALQQMFGNDVYYYTIKAIDGDTLYLTQQQWQLGSEYELLTVNILAIDLQSHEIRILKSLNDGSRVGDYLVLDKDIIMQVYLPINDLDENQVPFEIRYVKESGETVILEKGFSQTFADTNVFSKQGDRIYYTFESLENVVDGDAQFPKHFVRSFHTLDFIENVYETQDEREEVRSPSFSQFGSPISFVTSRWGQNYTTLHYIAENKHQTLELKDVYNYDFVGEKGVFFDRNDGSDPYGNYYIYNFKHGKMLKLERRPIALGNQMRIDENSLIQVSNVNELTMSTLTDDGVENTRIQFDDRTPHSFDYLTKDESQLIEVRGGIEVIILTYDLHQETH